MDLLNYPIAAISCCSGSAPRCAARRAWSSAFLVACSRLEALGELVLPRLGRVLGLMQLHSPAPPAAGGSRRALVG